MRSLLAIEKRRRVCTATPLWRIRVAAGAAALALVVSACGSDDSASASGAAPDGSSSCDLSKEPKDSPDCVVDAVGIRLVLYGERRHR